jgi:hypothetical protein
MGRLRRIPLLSAPLPRTKISTVPAARLTILLPLFLILNHRSLERYEGSNRASRLLRPPRKNSILTQDVPSASYLVRRCQEGTPIFLFL